MAHCNTILSQLLKLVSRHEFESLANRHHSGRSFRTATRWSQFVTMCIAQLSGRCSLRDVVDNLSAQQHRLYHLGAAKLSRSNVSDLSAAVLRSRGRLPRVRAPFNHGARQCKVGEQERA